MCSSPLSLDLDFYTCVEDLDFYICVEELMCSSPLSLDLDFYTCVENYPGQPTTNGCLDLFAESCQTCRACIELAPLCNFVVCGTFGLMSQDLFSSLIPHV